MKKVKAFTLMELLIGMIISTIVISFCYMSYTLIYKQFMNYKTIKMELVQALELNSVLNNDIGNSELVVFDNNELTLLNKQNEILKYNFNETEILRKSVDIIDTFKLKPINIVPHYLANENNLSNVLLSFSFDAIVLGEQEHFQFSKLYDAEMVVNDAIQNLQND